MISDILSAKHQKNSQSFKEQPYKVLTIHVHIADPTAILIKFA